MDIRDWVKARVRRILMLTLFLFVFSQIWAQMAMEIRFPFHFKVWNFSVVLFYVPEVPNMQTADAGRPAGD